ncbi:hypothetical protein KY290_030560 [Solanum tuberosum]|uniref:Uncharacterized protein n=1 Tax=Solanum tuberosum TaxID=4113 RepID=A0ABQ7U6L1_SOLTU|nr:hypothetical protein KY284_029582 [Solanum tuberosum]KAH0742567.1 hypothetical protein KY290_030560 [Solanum tuberosum]
MKFSRVGSGILELARILAGRRPDLSLLTLLKTASASSLVDAVTMANGIGPGIGAARILAGRPGKAFLLFCKLRSAAIAVA